MIKNFNQSLVPLDQKPVNVYINRLDFITQPLKRRHQRHYQGNKLHMAVDAFFLVVIMALIGMIININLFRAPADVYLELKVPETAISGQDMALEIRYGNLSREELKDAKLAFTVPENFQVEQVVPNESFDSKSRTVKIGDLTSRANGVIKIVGKPLGQLGSRQSFACALNYAKSGSDYQMLSASSYNIEGSVLSAQLELPKLVYSGAEFDGVAKITNAGNEEIDQIVLVFGDRLVVKQADQALSKNELNIGKVRPGETKQFELSFYAAENKPGVIDYAFVGYQIIDKQRLRQFEAKQEIDFRQSALEVTVKTERSVASANDSVFYDVEYANTSEQAINNLKLDFLASSRNFLLTSIKPQKNDLFDWDKSSVVIGAVPPRVHGKFRVEVNYSRNKIVINQPLQLQADIAYQIDGQSYAHSAKSNPTRILSEVSAQAAAYYYSPQGDQLGIGPLPPMVGIPTNYLVVWSIDNLGNSLSDLTLTGTLPANVEWTDSKSLLSGRLHYIKSSRQVIWQVDKIASEDGENKARFELSVTPQTKDVGKVLNLLTNIKLEARDDYCSKDISLQAGNITTNLQYDVRAAGKGKVVSDL